MDNRPHILYLIDVLWGLGGAEATLLRTAQLLPKDRFRCSIATFRRRPGLSFIDQFPCPVYEFPLRRALTPSSLRMAFKLRNFIRSERVDIVHTWFQTADLWGGPIAKLSGCPVLVSSRRDMGILRSTKHHVAYRLIHRMFDQVQAVSSAVRQEAIRAEGLDPEKVITIRNGIEMDKIDAAPPDVDLRQRLAEEGLGPVVVTVGHLRRVKGTDVLIRAAAEVCGVRPKTVFLVIGATPDQEYFQELNGLVRALGLERNVRFMGQSERAWSVLKASDVFTLLSRSEGMSNALLEAMACRLPSVATAVGGTPEVIDEGRTGYLVESEDAHAAADRLLTLLANPARARSMGEAARRDVAERFSAERMISEMVRCYDGLLRARAGHPLERIATVTE